MNTWLKRTATVMVLALVALGLARAATHKYQEQEDAFRKACLQQLQGQPREAVKAKYPTPEIHMVSSGCLMPGATVETIVNGKFSPGSKLFVENDNIEVVKADLAGTQFRATLKAPAGIGPETAAIAVISPAGQMARSDKAVRIGGANEWTMDAANGWKVVARSQLTTPCPVGSDDPAYDVSFFRKGEATPFEKLKARLTFSLWGTREYAFALEAAPSAAMGGDYVALMEKLRDPNLTPAQREQLMTQITKASEQMQAQMKKLTDPAYMKQQADEAQLKEQQFGCKRIEVSAQNGKLTGEMRCSDKVGTRLGVTGSVTAIK
jgi:hypothetical protein